jgi:hypothetical protein
MRPFRLCFVQKFLVFTRELKLAVTVEPYDFRLTVVVPFPFEPHPTEEVQKCPSYPPTIS